MALLSSVAIVLAGCGRDGSGRAQGSYGEPPPMPVTYIELRSEDVQVHADYAGRLHGYRSAEVRARVGGLLDARLYDEGDVVDQDTALFRIDPAPFRIAVQRAEAELANARATLNQAEREWQRVAGLFAQEALSERERDRAQSERELAQARLALADTGVAEARLSLGYTTVRAPIAGVTGVESVTEGNLLTEGALLTTVTQLDPIHVRFTFPGEDAVARGALADSTPESLAVELLLPDGRSYGHPGTIDFTASTVDPRTGSVIARAVFPNPDHRLLPGALVRVHLMVALLESVHRVDPEAVSQLASGPVVYVVDQEDTARARSVRLGPVVDGGQVVLEGLAEGDRVVVNGQVALRDGAKVAPRVREEQPR